MEKPKFNGDLDTVYFDALFYWIKEKNQDIVEDTIIDILDEETKRVIESYVYKYIYSVKYKHKVKKDRYICKDSGSIWSHLANMHSFDVVNRYYRKYFTISEYVHPLSVINNKRVFKLTLNIDDH